MRREDGCLSTRLHLHRKPASTNSSSLGGSMFQAFELPYRALPERVFNEGGLADASPPVERHQGRSTTPIRRGQKLGLFLAGKRDTHNEPIITCLWPRVRIARQYKP